MSETANLYVVEPDGALRCMTPAAPANEEELQVLIAKHSELIGSGDGKLLLIEREHGIPDVQDGYARWAVDHLFVTRDGVPVLVEVKRAVDTRIRREVVAQMLDYAANSVAFWPAGSVAARFEASCEKMQRDAAQQLADFLGPDGNPSAFWAQVDANFKAGRIKLLFVADQIPRELARIVEFLNDQMTADVCAVELRYFQDRDGRRTLAPRIIGETERSHVLKAGARANPEPVTEEAWLSANIRVRSADTAEGAENFLDLATKTGLVRGVAQSQGSIYFALSLANGKKAYPFLLLKNGTLQIALGYVARLPGFQEEQTRRVFYERFSRAVGPLSAKYHAEGFPSFPVERLADPQRWHQFEQVCAEYLNTCRELTEEATA